MNGSGPENDGYDSKQEIVDAILREELEYLGEPPRNDLWALCLSGGGIRSATFSLGVLQGLAARKLLDRFHYLSTVSGGGYIGSWLSSWIARSSLPEVIDGLAGKTPRREAEAPQVSRLRAYANYLSPVWGLSTDFFTLVSIFLRNLLLNWLVLLPLLAAAVLFPRVFIAMLGWGAGLPAWGVWAIAALAMLLVGLGISYVVADLTDEVDPRHASTDDTQDEAAKTSLRQPGSSSRSSDARNVDSPTKPRDAFATECFLPIFAAAVLLSWIGFQKGVSASSAWLFVACGAAVHLLGCVWGLVRRRRRGLDKTDRQENIADVAFIFASGALGGLFVYGLVQFAEPEKVLAYATLVVPALLFCFWFATTVYVGLARAITSEMDREWWSRSGAWWLRTCLIWLAAFGLVIYGPEWIELIPGVADLGPKSWVAGGGLLGIFTGAIGYWSKGGTQLKEKAETFATAIGVRLLDLAAITFIVLLVIGASYVLSRAIDALDTRIFSPTWLSAQSSGETSASKREAAVVARETEAIADAAEASSRATVASANAVAATAGAAPDVRASTQSALAANAETARMAAQSGRFIAPELPARSGGSESSASNPHQLPRGEIAAPLFGLLILVGLLVSRFIGANTFSLHSMYGNRLVRAYLGASRNTRNPHWFTGFDPADNIDIARLQHDSQKHHAGRLLHVINIALNLVKPSGERLEWQQRKAAPFTVSPLHCGSPDLGYVSSKEYSGARGMSLARAMTISGAAASPNMGYHSAAPVAFVMTLFNVRLGWWLPNPSPSHADVWERSEPKSNLRPLLTEAAAQTTGSSPYVYLSDGGHFENLGLYEMVRRRCRSIVVVDATCDWKYEFRDLEGAIRKIRIDLGITIEFTDGLPTQERAGQLRRHYALGVIRYGDVDGKDARNGRICYIKPVLTGEEDVDVARYAAQHAGKTSPFPHQSTGDQFFTEAQFESYRVLGRQSIETAFGPEDEWPQQVRWLSDATDGARTPPPPGAAVPPGLAGGAASGATHMLSSMGQGALVASALTVGGVLGVTGTVALKDATVKVEPGAVIALDDQDRRLLRALSIPGGVLALDAKDRTLLRDLSIKGGALTLNADDRKLLQELTVRGAAEELQQLNTSVRAVAEAVVKLGEAVRGLAPADKLDAALAALSAQVRNLATAVSNLKLQGAGTDRIEVYSAGPPGTVRVDLVDLNRTLVAIHESLRVQGADSEQTRNAARMLADIIRQLEKLNATVAQTLPNRNVRGVGEGGGR